jgi:hypothetical protein
MRNWKVATALVIAGLAALLSLAVVVAANRESAFHDSVRRIALAHDFTDGLPSVYQADSGYYRDSFSESEWSIFLQKIRDSAKRYKVTHTEITTRKHGGLYCEYLVGDVKYSLFISRNDDFEVETGAALSYYSDRVKWYEPIARRLGLMR